MKNNVDIHKKLVKNYWVEKISSVSQAFSVTNAKVTEANLSSLDFGIESAIVKPIKSLAQNNEMTEYIIYLSFFGILLYKYFKQSELLISSPGIKSKNHDDDNGRFLFYKLNFAEDYSLKKVLQTTRNEVQKSINYKDYAYNDLRLILKKNNINDNLLYQFGFCDNRVNAQSTEFKKVNLQFKLERIGNERTKVKLNFDKLIFEKRFVEQFVSHYKNLLDYVNKTLDDTIGEIEILSQSEKRQLLVDFNDIRADYPSDKTIVDLFEEQSEKFSDHTALLYEGEVLTYKELNERSNQLAHYLREKCQIEPEDLVGLILDRSVWMTIGVLGILKSGAAYVPMDPYYPEDRIQFILRDASVKALILGNKGLIVKDELKGYSQVSIKDDWEGISTYAKENPGSKIKTSDMAYIIYTSGSTGRPKGVIVEHRNVVSLLFNKKFQFGFSENDVWTLFHSVCFDFSVWEIFGALLYGGKLIVVPNKITRTPKVFLKLLEKERVTVLNQIPTIFNHLAAEVLGNEGKRGISLRYVIFGGEALNPILLEKWHGRYPEVELVNMYGITETTVHVTRKEIRKEEIELGKSNIGKPIPTLCCYIMDERLRLVPLGVAGEIVVGGAGVSRGYLNRAELTIEKFIESPFVNGERLYRSGDLGRWLWNGDIEFLGRIDEQVKIRGYRIECGEIESLLLRLENVKEAVVIAKEGTIGNAPGDSEQIKYLTAYLNVVEVVSTSVYREYFKDLIPDYMIPSYYVQLDRFPLTSSGKIDKKALPDLDRSNISEEIYEAPRNETEEALVNIWEEVLGIEKIGINENFFSLGGNSIKGIRVINKIQEWLEEIVHVTVLFEAPTIKELVENIEKYKKDRETKKVDEAKVIKMRQIIKPLPPLNIAASKNPPVVFVLSPPRSGSTLLRIILGGHPQLFAPPELELLSFNTLRERKKVFSGRFSYFSEGTIRAIMEIKGCSAERAQAIMEEFEENDFTSQQFYGVIQEWLGAKILVDKTPFYTLDLEALKRAEDYFEAPKYIHLLRNPYAVVHSFEEAKLDQIFRYEHDFSVRELAELVWLICNQNIVAFFEGIENERKHTVKFEDLVYNTDRVVSKICDFLGIEYHEKMIRVYEDTENRMTGGIHAESKMLGDIKFFQHTTIDAKVVYQWRKQYTDNFLGDITRELAKSFGYLEEETDLEYSKILPAPEAEYYELSHSQRRLWILDQFKEGQIAYNIHRTYRLDGELNRESLGNAYKALVKRHEILRTAFVKVNGAPKQKIHDVGAPGLKMEIEYIDLRRDQDSQQQVNILSNEENHTPFDLEHGSLLRAKLVHIDEKKYVFLFTMHHIISDGWSMGLLVDEMLKIYNAYEENKGDPLPPPRLQYKDYSEWQNSEEEKKLIKKQGEYWKKEFEGELPVLNLPTDFVRPEFQSFEGLTINFDIGREEKKALDKIAFNKGATLYMVLLAVYNIFLSKISGQEDLIVGSDVAGRRHADLEYIVGNFVNTLAFRTFPTGNKTFYEFLEEIKKKVLDAFDNQDYPFDDLIEQVLRDRDVGRNPIFDVMFSFQEVDAKSEEKAKEEKPDSQKILNNYENRTSKLDLILSGVEVGERLFLSLEYCTKLFKKKTIEKFIGYFKEIVSTVIKNPDIKLKNITISLNLLKAEPHEAQIDFGF